MVARMIPLRPRDKVGKTSMKGSNGADAPHSLNALSGLLGLGLAQMMQKAQHVQTENVNLQYLQPQGSGGLGEFFASGC